MKTAILKLKSFLSRAQQVYREKGIRYCFQSAVKKASRKVRRYYESNLELYVYKLLMNRSFVFQARTYSYFYHKYNTTWKGERAVEIPIVREIMRSTSGRVLEVGNVLSHYFKVDHDVIDKYEKGEGVVNEDVVDFRPLGKYDLILSISTLEHVGWDEKPRESGKILRAIRNLRDLLTPEGRLVVTLPLGYNPEMDGLLEEGRLGFSECFCLKRVSKNNEWKEVEWREICGSRYAYPFLGANGLVIGIIDNTER